MHRGQKLKGWSHQMLLIDKLTDKENLFMTLFLSASSFYTIFTQVPKTFHSIAGRFLEAFSVFSLSQFVLFNNGLKPIF